MFYSYFYIILQQVQFHRRWMENIDIIELISTDSKNQ